MTRLFLFMIFCLVASSAWPQGAVLQGGPWMPGHIPQYVGQGSSQAVIQDGGNAGGAGPLGSGPGSNISEIGIVARGTGTPPYAGQGTGPFGTIDCKYDAPINNPTGYHFLCSSPNAQGGGLIAYGAGGGAGQLSMNCNINGVQTPCFGSINGLPTVINNAALKAVAAGQYLTVYRAGFYTPGDGGGAFYNFSSSACAVADNGLQVSPTIGTGCWIADFQGGPASVAVWGAKCNNAANDTTFIAAALTSAVSWLTYPGGATCLVNASMTGASNQTMDGNHATVKLTGTLTNNAVFNYANLSGFTVQNLTIDINNQTTTATGAIGLGGGAGPVSDCTIKNVNIIHYTVYGIAAGNTTRCRIVDNYIARDATSNSPQTVGIFLTSTGGHNSLLWIKGNILINNGIGDDCSQCIISDNNITGVGYGAGIALSEDAATGTNIATQNIIQNSSNQLDANSVRAPAIESYGAGQVIALNITNFNGGDGIAIGGELNAVVGNVSTSNGTRHLIAPGSTYSGFTCRNVTGSFTCDYSVFAGNVAADFLGSQTYNYLAENTPQHQFVFGNSFLLAATTDISMGTGNYRSYLGPALEVAWTWNPSSVASGGTTSSANTLTGATLADIPVCSFSLDLAGLTPSAYVNATNSVTFSLSNNTSGAVDLASGTVSCTLLKQSTSSNF